MVHRLVPLIFTAVISAGMPARAGHNVQLNFPGGVYIEESRGRIQVRFTEDGRTLKFEARGEFELAADEADLLRLSPEGRFRIEERRRGRTERRFVARGLPDGGIAREFEFRGDRREMTAEDSAWLQGAIGAILSHTTFAAATHVRCLLAQGGPEGALAAIESMESDHVQSVHYRELLEQTVDARSMARRVAERAGETMESDHELRLVLESVMERADRDSDTAQACAQASERMDSDHERRLVLQAVLAASDPSPVVSEAVLASVQGIDSDHERALVLSSCLDHHPLTVGESRSFFAATAGMDSDHEHARVLRDVLTRRQPEEILLGLLESARRIDSDHERGGVLLDLAAGQEVDGEVRREYLKTAEGLDSEHWRKRALQAVGEVAANPRD
jgi:hypothetical protein